MQTEGIRMIREIADLREILHNRKLSLDELRSLQDAKLRALIAHAWERVPYYQSLFRSAGLSPNDIRTIDELKRIPITAKEDINRAGLENTIAKGISPAACHRIVTSGSTGTPLTVYLTPQDLRIRRLLEFRSLLSIGFRPSDRLSVLGPEPPHATRFHQRLGFYRSENISALLPIEEQIRRLNKMRPTVFWAYPTVLRALLHQIYSGIRNIINPRILITSAECIDDILKDRIRSIWNDIEMFDFYGTAEVGRIALECPAHQGLHVNADHIILELLEDYPPAESGKRGGVAVTVLNAFAMPFIRYRLGDISVWIDSHCSCGSSFPLIRPVQGREDEMIQLPSGKLLSPFGLLFILRRFHEIDQFRFIQKNPGQLEILLAVREGLQQDFIPRIKADCLHYLKEPIHLEIAIVPFIEVNGKFKTFTNLNNPAP